MGMSLSADKIFKSHYPPEVVLAEMIGKKFGMHGISPDPEQLKEWLKRNWATLSMLAHAIHSSEERP